MFSLKYKVRFLFFTLVVFLFTSVPGQVKAEPNDWYVSIAGVSGNDLREGRLQLTASSLAKMIEQEIGKDNYQSVSIVISSCYSGGAAESMPSLLKGAYNIITSCDSFQRTKHFDRDGDGKWKGFIESFWDSVIANPDASVDTHFQNGKNESPKLTDYELYVKYESYREKIIEANEKRAELKQTLLPVPPPWQGRESAKKLDQHPQNVQSASKPGTKEIAAGDESNHAIIVDSHWGTGKGREYTDQIVKSAKSAFGTGGANFTSVKTLTPCTTADLDQWGKDSTIRDDMATVANIRKTLKNLKSEMNDKEHLLFFLTGHGNLVKRSASSSANTGAQNGQVFNNIDQSDTIGDYETSIYVAEEVFDTEIDDFVVDHFLYERWDSPTLVIQTVEETLISGKPVDVSINNIPLCEMMLEPDGPGLHYLTLPDYFILALLNTTDFTTGFEIEFNFADDGDSFKLATLEDIEIADYDFGHYGMSFVFHLDATPIPEPGSLLILGFGALILRKTMKKVGTIFD